MTTTTYCDPSHRSSQGRAHRYRRRVTRRRAANLFACGGGTSAGLALLGYDVVGIDYDRDACETHAAAGHATIVADLTRPCPIVGEFDLAWASPPCTAFSMAGNGHGRDLADVLVDAIHAEDWRPFYGPAVGPEVWLILPTMQALLEMRPTAIAMENVQATMPVMEACAAVLRRHGYDARVVLLRAEQYGVAQTRRRAFLLANRERAVQIPQPTHQRYVKGEPPREEQTLFETILPWVSMAEALGWPDDITVEHKRGSGMAERHGDREPRTTAEPAPSMTGAPQRRWALDRRCQQGPVGAREPVPVVEVDRPAPSMTVSGLALGQFVWRYRAGAQERQAERDITEPAPSLAFGHDAAQAKFYPVPVDELDDDVDEEPDDDWPLHRPATTIAGRGLVAEPGANANRFNGSTKSRNDGIRITVAEAARLQAFPTEHPWRGSMTSQYGQIGNAVPPPLAAAVAGGALGVDWQTPVAEYLAELYSVPVASNGAGSGTMIGDASESERSAATG